MADTYSNLSETEIYDLEKIKSKFKMMLNTQMKDSEMEKLILNFDTSKDFPSIRKIVDVFVVRKRLDCMVTFNSGNIMYIEVSSLKDEFVALITDCEPWKFNDPSLSKEDTKLKNECNLTKSYKPSLLFRLFGKK